MTQLSLDDFRADGDTYEPPHDKARLGTLLSRVKELMSDNQWRTLGEIAQATGGTEASVSARLRDFRKPRFGGLNVERRPRGERKSGLWEYRINEVFL